MNELREVPSCEIDVSKIVPYKNNWRHLQDAMFWFDLQLAQNQGSVFWQTISTPIILNDSMPAQGLVRVIKRKTHEVLYQTAIPIRVARYA